MYQFKKYSKLSEIKKYEDCIKLWERGDGFILRMSFSSEVFRFKNV